MTDTGNHRIQVFTAKGRFLRMFERRGQGRWGLYLPCGITIDTSDRVYVSESSNHCVFVFTSEGQFLTSFGEGAMRDEFQYPAGLAVDSSGVLCVCDFSNYRVQPF